jgi:hypothetical protein
LTHRFGGKHKIHFLKPHTHKHRHSSNHTFKWIQTIDVALNSFNTITLKDWNALLLKQLCVKHVTFYFTRHTQITFSFTKPIIPQFKLIVAICKLETLSKTLSNHTFKLIQIVDVALNTFNTITSKD